MQKRQDIGGFSLIELSLALTIMALVFAASFRLINAYRMQANITQQAYNISMLANAVKNNAKLIMDTSMTVCTNITNAYSDDGWGWRHPGCLNTSPFPVYDVATNILTYNIDTANFPAAVSSIINNTGTYCPYTGQTATTVTFNCGAQGVTGIQYKTSIYPTVNTYATTPGVVTLLGTFVPPHNTGTNADFLNFLDFPSAIYIQYNQYMSNTGSTVVHNDMLNGANPLHYAYKLDMTDLYLDRVKKTRDNLIVLDAALRGYAIGNMTSEFENVPPNGLASKDVFFVPWIWQVLASTQAATLTLCGDPNTCSSIASGTQWATAAQTTNFAAIWLLITSNIMSGNLVYTADAFGDPLRIVPIANGCSGNVSGCIPSANLPPVPQGNYLSAMVEGGYAARPPYSSLVVNPLCTGNTAYPDFCRWTVVYSN